MLIEDFTPLEQVLPGQPMPSFSLRSTTNRRVRSTDLLGRRSIVGFTGEAGSRCGRILTNRLRAAFPLLSREGANVLAIAPVSFETGALAEPGVALPFPLLRDVGAAVHRRFGSVDWSDQPAAAMFIVNQFGRVIYRALGGLGETLPTPADILNFVRFDEISCPGCGTPLPLSEVWPRNRR